MRKIKKVPHSTASYIDQDGEHYCDIEELANKYKEMKNIPMRMGFVKASEVAILCHNFLHLLKINRKWKE